MCASKLTSSCFRVPKITLEVQRRFQLTHPLLSLRGHGSSPWRVRSSPVLTSSGRRTLMIDCLPLVLVPPFVFTGLLLGLWTYKCMMTVLFQDKIIYMPYMPPGARSETIEDYEQTCKPAEWKDLHINSLDGTRIVICKGEIPNPEWDQIRDDKLKTQVVICYFQGNGSSTPPRLPLLSNVLKSIKNQSIDTKRPYKYTLLALSYRGYWKSSGRASQAGIELDAQAMLQWALLAHTRHGVDLRLILWGQSIGAGIACSAAATYATGQDANIQPAISALILETPFTSIKSMLLALYPQTWLPYKYLWPFLWNHWDSEMALRRIASLDSKPKVLLLPATRDEVVPPEEADKLQALCCNLSLLVERRNVIGALHTEATTRREGQAAVASFVIGVGRSD